MHLQRNEPLRQASDFPVENRKQIGAAIPSGTALLLRRQVALWPFGRRLLLAAALPWALFHAASAEEVWRFDRLPEVAGHRAKVVGEPKPAKSPDGPAASFDGKADGVFVPSVPIAGAKAFTIEVLFYPQLGGEEAQRFVHVQDKAGKRGLLEVRANDRGWWLDTFLRTGEKWGDKGLVLIDPARVHAAGKWYWVALRYDGQHMASFVNGAKELEGEIAFPPFTDGSVSVGVRQNLISWFKGAIAEVRFHREAVPEEKLQRLAPEK